MSSRLSDSSDLSDDENPSDCNDSKRKLDDFNEDSSEDQTSKRPRFDSSQSETYYRESEDEGKDAHGFGNVRNFYDRNYSTDDKSGEESDEKQQSSYLYENSLSDGKDASQSESTLPKSKGADANLEMAESNDSRPSTMAERLMKKWGFKEGKGLGKDLQGRAEPVLASIQKGRRGLGLELKELEKAHIEFKPDEETVNIKEEILWLHNPYESLPSAGEVADWKDKRKEGPRKESIDGETTFCDELVVKSVVNSKSVFDRLDKHEMQEARTRSNPFETIRGSIFLNRAAVKMANMDKACNFMFTAPNNLQPDELLYFADVCAGPGGFSEYVLWRKKWYAKGFGFTLKGENDFKLHDFHAGPCETFYPYYGPKDNGDVYDPDNQIAFRDLIMQQTDKNGVHFMMADGGFSVEGQENIQEILSKQLYLCQCLVALMIVRTRGHFVTKVFDLFTPFSAGLVYIMYRCFDRISIFKPNTSRPANSERYLICQGKKPDIDHIIDYLFKTNKKLSKYSRDKKDVIELVPVEQLISEENFYKYLKDSNELLGERQIVGLKKIAAYAEDKNLIEKRQKIVREECLKHWGLPDEPRTLPKQMKATQKMQMLMNNSFDFLEKCAYKEANKLTKENFKTILTNEYDWLCTPCSAGEDVAGQQEEDRSATFYLALGRKQVYKYCERGQWEQVRNDYAPIVLPLDTLVYAEVISELKKEKHSQVKKYGLHILDAFTLGTENISKKHFTDRQKLINLFCKALWKPADANVIPVRPKEFFQIDCHLHEKIVPIPKVMKNRNRALGYFPRRQYYDNDDSDPYYYILRNVIFFKMTEEPWAFHFSNSKRIMYYYNKENKQSLWEVPDTAKASFNKVVQSRAILNWQSDKSLTLDDIVENLRKKHSHSK